ncbi:MAG: zinc ABC transporter substrate-binding protein [Caldilineaceae bacterium]
MLFRPRGAGSLRGLGRGWGTAGAAADRHDSFANHNIAGIAGDKAQIAGIVPEGVNSHTFEPAPSDAKVLAQADPIFANGLKLEEPTVKLAEANLKQGAEIVLLGEQTITPDQYVYDFSFPRNRQPQPASLAQPGFCPALC